MSFKTLVLAFSNGAQVTAVQVAPGADLTGLAEALGISPPDGTIAIVGGAAGLDGPEMKELRDALEPLLAELAAYAVAHNLAVIDGGTSSGAMRLLGEVRTARGSDFPLIGVAPLGKVAWGNRSPSEGGDTPLDANHSGFVLVEADEWGGEVYTLAAVAHVLAGEGPKLEVLINGGAVSRHDVQSYLRMGGHVMVIEGSGRFADEVASALRHGQGSDPDIRAILETKRVSLFPLHSPQGMLTRRLSDLLEAGGG
jgi:hypothetical protein